MSEPLFTTAYRGDSRREFCARLAGQMVERYAKRKATAGPRCPTCGSAARLDDGRCITCAAAAARK